MPTALADCNESLRLRQNTKALSYRALVFFRMGEWDGAIRDCDAILRIDPRAADSLFERGISKLRKGDTAGGDADIVASKARDPMVEKVFAGYGITP